MRDEYNISDMHPRRNPYTKKLKQQITLNINTETVAYFKTLSEQVGIPYQTLINLYLTDCSENKRQPSISWG
jgi:predicted DNA binding CopG/RHH family protein